MVEGHASPQGGTPTLAALAGGRVLALGACLGAVLTLSACGGSSHSSASSRPAGARQAAVVCVPAARGEVARVLGVSVASVSALEGTSSQAAPECRLRARLRSGGVVGVLVTVDSAPQAYFRLERTAVEDEQQFGSVRLEPAPVQVPRLGLDAYWFPAEHQVMTTDGVRLITAKISWRHAPASHQRALAESAARSFLGPLHPQAADPPGS